MVASIPFLERLVPAAGYGFRVRPVLPLRFGPAPVPEASVDAARREASSLTGTPAADRAAEHAAEPEPRFGKIDESDGGPTAQPQETPAGMPAPSPAMAGIVPTRGPAERASRRAAWPPTVADRQSPETIPARPVIIERPAKPRVTPLSQVQRYPDVPSRAPLANSSVALPTEIHVSIDRIDVRMPAPSPSPEARPNASRRPAPASSLSNYLRQGREARGTDGAR